MSEQLLLNFDQAAVSIKQQHVGRKPLVVLSETDLAYRQSIIDGELEFPESFLKETRAQRLGCSVREIDCMFSYERARELADEAIVMRMLDWQFVRPVWIDWEAINHRAKEEARERAQEFAEYKRLKSAGMEFLGSVPSTKKTRKRV